MHKNITMEYKKTVEKRCKNQIVDHRFTLETYWKHFYELFSQCNICDASNCKYY